MLYAVSIKTDRVHVEANQPYQAAKKARPILEEKLGRKVFDRDLIVVAAADLAVSEVPVRAN